MKVLFLLIVLPFFIKALDKNQLISRPQSPLIGLFKENIQNKCSDLHCSSQKLCLKCEFNRFPERFTLCFFCDEPQKRQSLFEACLNCRAHLVEKLKLNEQLDHVLLLELGVFSFMDKIKSFIFLGTQETDVSENVKKDLIKDIVISENDKKLVSNCAQAEQLVEHILIKYIFKDMGKLILNNTNSVIKKPNRKDLPKKYYS